MKRVLYLVVFLAIAAAFYVYAYPKLAGVGTADAQTASGSATTASADGAGKAGGQSRGGKAGGYAVGVVSAIAQSQTIPITKSAVGYMEAASTVVLRTRADGIVVQQNVQEGQMVKTGDLLFKLDDSSLQATIAKDQAQTAKDQANADAAQVALQREQDLVKKGVDPQSTLDADVATAKSAQATVQVDNAQLKSDQVALAYMTITAPIDGRVGTVNTSVGNVVHASDTSTGGLLTITQMSPLRVSFSIAEGDLDSFRHALSANQKLPVKVAAPGDQTARATGTLSFIDSSVDTSSGTIVIKADVDDSAGKLWPGQYVTAITELGAYNNATTVPLVAVQQGNSGSFVYVVGGDGKVKKQSVTVVASVGDTAVVGNELKPGDHVVTEGQLTLSDGSSVRETVKGAATDVATTAGNTGTATSGGTDGGTAPGAKRHSGTAPASNS